MEVTVEKGLRTVPIEPIRRVLERWIAQHDEEISNTNSDKGAVRPLTGQQHALVAIFGTEDQANQRTLYRIMDRREGTQKPKKSNALGTKRREHGSPLRQQSISFEMADKILCGLGIAWTDDPELFEAYQKVDLFSLDLMSPTSEKTAKEAEELMYETYLRLGNIDKTCRELGVNRNRLKAVLGSRVGDAVCSADGCSNKFLKREKSGGRIQRFCSDQCSRRAWEAKRAA